MEMEDKESTESGSPGGNSDVDSPPSSENGGAYGGAYGGDGGGPGGGGVVVQETMNMGVNMNMEKNAGATCSPTVVVGGGGGGVMGGGLMGLDGGGGGSGELMMGKKKRGRPRKYDSDGNLRAGYLRSPLGAAAQTTPQPGFTLSAPPSYQFTSSSKRGRGRSSGSGNWKALASLGGLFSHTAGGDFTPHVVTAYTGEDVAGKILTFAQKGTRGVCVLSANGSVSNVTIRQPGSSGGLLTYEGRFEILTLTGSYTISDSGGIKSRTGGLSVSLASSDGRVIGGGVAGLLMAASPIQIVVGSFVPNGVKVQKRKYNTESRKSPAFQFSPATVTAAIPISQAAPAGNIYPRPTTQFQVQNQGEGDQSISNRDNPNSASTDTSDWNDSGPSSDQRPSPDINISVPVEEH